MLFVGILIGLLPLVLIVRTILSIQKSANVSEFMKSLVKFILYGVFLVSLSVTIHHFYNIKKAQMSLGVLIIVQGMITVVVTLASRFILKR